MARSGSAAIAGPSFAYVTAWSHADTWPGGAVPQAGDAVTIGQDQSILLDISSPPLRQLRIHGRLLAKDAEVSCSASAAAHLVAVQSPCPVVCSVPGFARGL